MKKGKLIYVASAIIFISVAIIYSGCKKSSDPTAAAAQLTTVSQDKLFLSNSMTDISQCMSTLNSGDLATAFYGFTGLSNGTANNKVWMETLRDKLDNLVDFTSIYTPWKLNFSQSYGTYTWNQGSQTWTKTALSNQIVINFPSSPAQSFNDCQMQLTQYSDNLYFINNDSVYLPTNLNCTLKRNQNTLFSLALQGSYNPTGFPCPQNLVVDMFCSPFNYHFTVTQLTPTQFKATGSLQSLTGCETTFNVKASFANNDFEQFDVKQDLNNVIFDATKGDLSVSGSWDAHSYYSFINPSSTQLNSTINFEVFYQSVKIGDLRFANVGNGNELFVFYKDGTSENSSIYHSPLVSDIKAMLTPSWGAL